MFENHKKTAQSLYAIGHTVSINDKVKEQRKALGLSAEPPTVIANPEAMAQLKKVLAAAGFEKIVE